MERPPGRKEWVSFQEVSNDLATTIESLVGLQPTLANRSSSRKRWSPHAHPRSPNSNRNASHSPNSLPKGERRRAQIPPTVSASFFVLERLATTRTVSSIRFGHVFKRTCGKGLRPALQNTLDTYPLERAKVHSVSTRGPNIKRAPSVHRYRGGDGGPSRGDVDAERSRAYPPPYSAAMCISWLSS